MADRIATRLAPTKIYNNSKGNVPSYVESGLVPTGTASSDSPPTQPVFERSCRSFPGNTKQSQNEARYTNTSENKKLTRQEPFQYINQVS